MREEAASCAIGFCQHHLDQVFFPYKVKGTSHSCDPAVPMHLCEIQRRKLFKGFHLLKGQKTFGKERENITWYCMFGPQTEMEKKGFKNPTNILFIGSLNNISTGTNKRLYFLTFSNEQEVSLQYLSAACSLPTQEEETRCNQKTTLLESFCLRAPCKSKGKGCQQTVLNY